MQPDGQGLADAEQHCAEQPSATGDGAQADNPEYEQLLRRALGQAPDALVDFAAEHRDELTMSFMLWLADR